MLVRYNAPQSDESGITQFRRRALLGFFLMALPLSATAAQCELEDDEWFRRFRLFVKLFNAVVESLNDGKVNVSIWRKMRAE